MDQKLTEFFERLKGELEKSTTWPSEYLFKFIVPTSDEKTLAVQEIFNDMGAVINTKKSKNEKYTSVSVNAMMESAEAVIEKYKQAAEVEGIISL
jgi:hypothetical protein